MRIIDYLRKSLALTQAVIALMLSVLIALFVSGFSLNMHLVEERDKANNLAQEILTAAEGGATNAAWTLDSELAQQVVKSITALGMVQDAQLVSESGDILASDKKSVQESKALVKWITTHFIGDEIVGVRKLYIQFDNEKRQIGALSIKLNSLPLAQEFLGLAATVVITGLLQAVIIALVLLWISSWLLSSPLRRVTASISNIDPDDPDPKTLANLRFHKKNEMGQLISHIEQMLKGLITAQVQLKQLATKDPLTGMLNRTLIADRLSQAIISAKRNKTKVAVLFIDMDRFKTINDSLGHDVGDTLLIEVASRMARVLRSNDSIGRLGGDEFLVVIEGDIELGELIYLVQRIDEALSLPFLLKNQEIQTSGSIGISLYPNNGDDATQLMRCADLAMYEAKCSNKHWHFYAKEMSEKVEARLRIEAALNYALGRREFHLNYQPKINSKTGALVGCEALIRWNNKPEATTVEAFIKIAEENGAIIAMGEWVLETACQQIKTWKKEYGPISVAVNVSGRQIQDEKFSEKVLSIIRKYDVDPQLLELEITETVLMGALDKCLIVLKELRQHGISIAIDDFGTGYCSLAYLSRLPVDILKIDQSFVSGEQPSIAVLEMIVAMAKALGLKTIAEGVETQEQKDWLVLEGCDYLQGYLISKPISHKELEERFFDRQAES